MTSQAQRKWNSRYYGLRKKRGEKIVDGILLFECLTCKEYKRWEDYYERDAGVTPTCKLCAKARHKVKYKGMTPAQILETLK